MHLIEALDDKDKELISELLIEEKKKVNWQESIRYHNKQSIDEKEEL